MHLIKHLTHYLNHSPYLPHVQKAAMHIIAKGCNTVGTENLRIP